MYDIMIQFAVVVDGRFHQIRVAERKTEYQAQKAVDQLNKIVKEPGTTAYYVRALVQVEKSEITVGLTSPIAQGETPEQAVRRMSAVFGKPVTKFAVHIHDEPIIGDDQQFLVIIGTVWAM